jgi:hypothetical protein
VVRLTTWVRGAAARRRQLFAQMWKAGRGKRSLL